MVSVFYVTITSGLALGPTQRPGKYVLAFLSRVKSPGTEPKNSPVSSDHVMMHNTKFPLLIYFQLNKQQYLKAVRGSGTDIYGKDWAGCSAD